MSQGSAHGFRGQSVTRTEGTQEVRSLHLTGGLSLLRSRWSGRCIRCKQRGRFQRECPHRRQSELSTGPGLQAGTGVESKCIRDIQTVKAEKRIMPSVRSRDVRLWERTWQIPLQVNGVFVSAVVDTAAEITIIFQMVYDQAPGP